MTSSAPTYVFENGLRKVLPYYQLFKTHIKTRWEGRTIVDVYTKELGQSESVIIEEIKNHNIYVLKNFGRRLGQEYIKGWEVLQDRKICKHDVIYNFQHMHEPSVIEDVQNMALGLSQSENSKIAILHRCKNILVINKPSGIPTHPTANYRYNSITEILKFDLELLQIWPSHRLDKLTSGVLIFGLNKPTGQMLLKIIEHKLDLTQKVYYARVKGEFPKEPFIYTCPVFLVNVNGGYLMPYNLPEIPLNSSTKFTRTFYNAELNESVVECAPLSGKMHQIRIHLRNLRFPIANDFVYNDIHSDYLSPLNRLKNIIELEIYNRMFQKYPCSKSTRSVDEAADDINKFVDITQFIDEEITSKLLEVRELAAERLQQYRNEETCAECGRVLFEVERLKNKSFIYLHAHRYTFEGDEEFESFDFKTALPQWCFM